ncbi:MAG: hypothetical protein ACO1SX_26990 [Actinomycetota bacterium]
MPSIDLADVAKSVEMARERLIYGLEQTPDEQLNQSVTETAKSPLRIAAFAVRFVGFMGPMLAAGTLPDRNAEWPEPKTREEAIQMVDTAFRSLEATIVGLTEEDLQRPMMVPWRAVVPTSTMVVFGVGALGYIQGQLNYAQTVYGDMEPNIPPQWFPAND